MEIPWHDYARQDGNILIDKAEWQTEQAQIKLEEAESLKKELLGAVDGDDYLKE